MKQHPWNLHLRPGYKSEWGGFLLSSIRWPEDGALKGEFNLDYRINRGFGFGPNVQYNSSEWGQGNLKLYRASDDDPLTDSRGIAIDRERDLAQWSHRLRRGSLTATSVLSYESDEYMRRDFFEEQYQQNVQPNSYFELSKNWSNLNKNTQIKIIQDEINKFANLNNLPKLFSIEKFEYSKLLTLSFSDETYINKPQLFLDFQKYLNSKVDSRIDVFYKELIDFNKLRLKNSPQKLV